MKYRSASASAYKWETIGGPSILNESSVVYWVGPTQTAASTDSSGMGDPVTAQSGATVISPLQTLTLPLAGDYDITARGVVADTGSSGATDVGRFGYKVGATAASYASAATVPHASNHGGTGEFTRRNVGVAAATVLTAQVAGSSNVQFTYHSLAARPIRVG